MQPDPIRLIVVPGTGWQSPKWRMTYDPAYRPMQEIAAAFGVEPVLFEWSGDNSSKARHAAAASLADRIANASGVCLVGFSHGGNVASEAASHLIERASARVDLLVTIATPVTGNYRTGGARWHIHLYSPQDRVQSKGGESVRLPGVGACGPAGREFPGAENIAIEGVPGNGFAGSHGNILWHDATWQALREQLQKTDHDLHACGYDAPVRL